MTVPAKILLVDDQSLYREGLVELFKKWSDLAVVADVADGKSALEACAEHHPDIVLMDVKMPRMDGITACGEIHSRFPGIAVVMLSLYGDKDRVLSAITNGANGYLLKNIHARQLHDKLLAVLKGSGVLSDEAAAICIDALRAPRLVTIDAQETQELVRTLTDHEKELLQMVANGASNRDIAQRLYIGESTVKKQISFVLTKLNLANRVQAAVFALRSGIAE